MCIYSTQVQFIVAIVPSDRAEVYSAIKRFCHVEKALPCQVIRSRTLDNGRARHSVIEKVALQINCKLGGALWALHLPHVSSLKAAFVRFPTWVLYAKV